MAITLEQDVAFKEMPVGTDWIFTISSTNVTGNYKFKYIAELCIDNYGVTNVIKLKFSPNSTDNGIINISDILEQYVSSDYLGKNDATYKALFKGAATSDTRKHPIQLTDKFSLSTDVCKRLTIKWGEEYSANATDAPTEYLDELTSSNYLFWNGMAYNNEQSLVSGEYGINLEDWNSNSFIIEYSTHKLLTDAPADKQLIGDNEYATLSLLNGYFPSISKGSTAVDMVIDFRDIDGAFISSATTSIAAGNGGYNGSNDTALTDSARHLMFAGVGTANMLGAGVSIPSDWASYDVYFRRLSGHKVSKVYKYFKKSADCKGYEKIRLTWLNKYGVWDYYTFNKKNLRSTDIKRTEFNRVKGDWNSSTFTKYGYERGVGVLGTIATETMSLNSDWFTNDEEAAWIEQLFVSPEVYILGDYDINDTATGGAKYGNYLTPVIVTNKGFDRYTRANDKVAQYELDIEYSINKRIQRG